MDAGAEKKADGEPNSEILINPARVLPAQEKYVKFLEGSRYVPVKKRFSGKPATSGFVLLRDLRPSEAEVLSLTDAPSAAPAPAGGQAPAAGPLAPRPAATGEEPQTPRVFSFS